MSNPIRVALDKAGQATCPTAQTVGGSCAPICLHCPRVAANAIAAFLRALTDGAVLTLLSKAPDPYYGWRDTLADAVLTAAKDQTHD
jgi:hypothetical protein